MGRETTAGVDMSLTTPNSPASPLAGYHVGGFVDELLVSVHHAVSSVDHLVESGGEAVVEVDVVMVSVDDVGVSVDDVGVSVNDMVVSLDERIFGIEYSSPTEGMGAAALYI